MIALFVISGLAGYFLSAAFFQKERQISARFLTILGILAGILMVAIVLVFLDRNIPLNHIARVINGSFISYLLFGALTGFLLAYWQLKLLRNYYFRTHKQIHIFWLCLLAVPFTLGLMPAIVPMMVKSTGIRSVESPFLGVTFRHEGQVNRASLSFAVERTKVSNTDLWKFAKLIAHGGWFLESGLNRDMEYYKLANHLYHFGLSETGDNGKALAYHLDYAKYFSKKYIKPIFDCISPEVDAFILIQNFSPVAHGLRQFLSEGRKVLSGCSGCERHKNISIALEVLKDLREEARRNFCELNSKIPRDERSSTTDNFQNNRESRGMDMLNARMATVPHFYTWLAWFYSASGNFESGREVLEEADELRKINRTLFEDDLNYNRTRGYTLYFLDWPLRDVREYQKRALDFAERVVNTIPMWPNKEIQRELGKRYVRAERLLRQEMAFLQAQDGRNLQESLGHARTYYQETTGVLRQAISGRGQMRRSYERQNVIRSQGMEWGLHDIYSPVTFHAISAHAVYGYTLMAYGAQSPEPNVDAMGVNLVWR